MYVCMYACMYVCYDTLTGVLVWLWGRGYHDHYVIGLIIHAHLISSVATTLQFIFGQLSDSGMVISACKP